MNRVDNYINMLLEFDYKKNGKVPSIDFLKIMINYLQNTYEFEWENKNDK